MAAVLELKARLDNLLATAQEETKHISIEREGMHDSNSS